MSSKQHLDNSKQKRLFFELLDVAGQFDLKDLRCLCELNRAGGQADARKLFVDDGPQYSKAISKLEENFGFKIRAPKKRSNDPVKLNSRGEELAKLADTFLSELSYMRNLESSVVLTIGSGETTIQSLLLPKLKDLKRELGSKLCIEFKNKQTRDLIEMLKNGAVDLAFMRGDSVYPPLACEELIKVTYCLCFPSKFKKDFRETDPMGILSKRPVALMEGHGRLRKEIVEALNEKKPMVRLECTSHAQIQQAVETGEYCGLMPEYCAERLDPKKFVTVPLAGFSDLTFSIVWNNEDKESYSQLRKKLPDTDDYLVDRAIEAFKKIFK